MNRKSNTQKKNNNKKIGYIIEFRYNRSIHQYYNNDYHRQFNLSQPSVATASSLIMDASYSCDTTQLTANQQQRQQQQQSFSQPGHYLATHVGFNSGLSGGPTSMERSYYNDNNYHQLRCLFKNS